MPASISPGVISPRSVPWALDLEDLCAEQGIPLIEYKSIAKKTPEKKAVPAKRIKPDYFLQEGKRVAYTYTHIADCYKLTEGDTVIVSDSVYCGLEGHDTETVLGLIWVKERSGTRKSYLFMLGYCAECQKYYMDSADYKTVYRLGRPEVTVLLDLGRSDYQITSGEVFDLERNHLQKLEGEIQGEIDGIRSQPDYISQYAVQDGAGPYDDGTLRYAKSVSREKYEPRLEELFGYTDRPYEYRVDIVADGRTEVYYVGAADISLGHQKKVISANSSLGRELVHYQTIKVTKEGKEYDIKLSRQFDIAHRSLYGYVNLRTDEDIIFRRGVTDPFLVRVLNMRKKQHNLIDIFVTIQENQNAIVDAPFRQNLIVQGCAGSGKTMVMLHRLSSLKYNQRSFDFGCAMILTPNEQFSLHIKGLAEGLQIGGIVRTSVEEYYIRMLTAYAPEFRPGKELASELGENQRLVDYIYSDQFLSDFEAAYQRVIAERNTLVRFLDALAEEMQETPREVDLSQDAVVIPQIRMALDGLEAKIRPKERAIQEAKAEYDRMTARKQFLEERLPEAQKFAEFVVRDALPRVYTKISVVSSETQRSVGAAKEQVQRFMEEREQLRKSLNPFGKQAKLSAVDKKIQAEEQKLNTELARLEKQTSLFGMETAEMSDEEVLAWMGQVVLYVPEIREEIRFCKRGKEEWERLTAEYSGIDAGIAKADMDYQKAVSQGYSGEVTGAIAHLREQLRRYSPVNTFHLVFSEATAAFKNEIGLKSVRGKYHRYDLYAALVFAMKFFNRAVGTAEFMCIDEGQDLALNEYRLIYKLNQEKVVFNIYGDTNQLIKPGRGIRDWAELRKRIEAEVFTLNENYRNTNQITRFCNDSFGMDVHDKRVIELIKRYLKAGVLENGLLVKTTKGSPQGGPLSPLLANIYLNEYDQEMASRGVPVIRYADDIVVLAKSPRAVQRLLESTRRYLEKKLKLKMNVEKSRVVSVFSIRNFKFLGFALGKGKNGVYIRVHAKSLKKAKAKLKELTFRSQGRNVRKVMENVKVYMRGWLGYFGIASMKTTMRRWDEWLRRRFRVYIWKQWKVPKARIRNLMKLGIPRYYAYKWGYVKAYWNVARSPILTRSITIERLARAGYYSLSDRYESLHLCD